MTNHLSQTDLDRIYNKGIKKIGKDTLENLKKRQRLIQSSPQIESIFLCHSHLDRTIVNKIAFLFSHLKVEFYIDWMDTTLPQVADRNTAAIIEHKIKNSSKFLFLATYNGLRSKWCNWELGFAYSSKGEKDFAILPIESRSGNWKGNEYLNLYPEMQIDISNKDSITASDINISYFEDKTISFNQWLKY